MSGPNCQPGLHLNNTKESCLNSSVQRKDFGDKINTSNYNDIHNVKGKPGKVKLKSG